MLLTSSFSLFASFCLGVALGSLPTPLSAKLLARRQAGSDNIQEFQCAVCPEDIETDAGTAALAFDQGTDQGITMCTYEESSGAEIVCPYVTDTGDLNSTVTYCPETIALTNCVND
ncbi:hypothetical protein K503DRAFT_51891 [Rhizopogon vinicolor AM-OR11-026]|uniref:Uncharacterized protein n=1 Tax=Rhizopogon vinicolor AM-OR11-026 TaxID=1314800 RepID=A0A1B7N4N9_9AGAM|nr:hypothetical protein K503DRAFT_51891 [Rhizopogon vinicolor AM-OR11-026]